MLVDDYIKEVEQRFKSNWKNHLASPNDSLVSGSQLDAYIRLLTWISIEVYHNHLRDTLLETQGFDIGPFVTVPSDVPPSQ